MLRSNRIRSKRGSRKILKAAVLLAAATLGMISTGNATYAQSGESRAVQTWNELETGVKGQDLSTMHAISPNEVWIGGRAPYSDETPAALKTTILRCSQIACASLPVPDMGEVNSISGTSRDIWVGATKGAMHWDGENWTTFGAEVGFGSVGTIKSVAANDVWAVKQGHWTGNNWEKDVELAHWDGSAWKNFVIKDVFQGYLNAIDASSSNNVWFAGGFYDGTLFGTRPSAIRWDGEKFDRMLEPENSEYINGKISAIAVKSPVDVWVGGSAYQPILNRWNGRDWENHDPHFPGDSETSEDSMKWGIRKLLPSSSSMGYLAVGDRSESGAGFIESVIAMGAPGKYAEKVASSPQRAEDSFLAVDIAEKVLWRTSSESGKVMWASASS